MTPVVPDLRKVRNDHLGNARRVRHPLERGRVPVSSVSRAEVFGSPPGPFLAYESHFVMSTVATMRMTALMIPGVALRSCLAGDT